MRSVGGAHDDGGRADDRSSTRRRGDGSAAEHASRPEGHGAPLRPRTNVPSAVGATLHVRLCGVAFPKPSVAAHREGRPRRAPAPRATPGVTEMRAAAPATTVTSRDARVVPGASRSASRHRHACRGRRTSRRLPGATGTVSELVHGPATLVENAPAGELERSVTATGRATADDTDSSSGADATPATTLIGATGPIERVDCAHARNDRQAPLCDASGRSTAQSVSPAPHAPLIGSLGIRDARVADRGGHPIEDLPRLRGEVGVRQAGRVARRPREPPVVARPDADDTLKERIASTWAETYAAICSKGTIVQPHAVSRGHAPFASGLYAVPEVRARRLDLRRPCAREHELVLEIVVEVLAAHRRRRSRGRRSCAGRRTPPATSRSRTSPCPSRRPSRRASPGACSGRRRRRRCAARSRSRGRHRGWGGCRRLRRGRAGTRGCSSGRCRLRGGLPR